MKNEIILQNLRDFTVQIRRPNSEHIVGTGIAISLDGKVITCAHVVEEALGCHPRQANGAKIGVYFPQAGGGETKTRYATVAACFPEHDDDVVLLQLEGAAPLGSEQIPKLGTAEPSAFHPFRSYGYRRLAKYQAGHAHGTILDLTEPPVAVTLHADPVQLESKQINQGMSGAGVLDTERNLVVGIISEVWRAAADGIDQGTAWAVNAQVLSLPPLAVILQEESLPKQAAAQPQQEYRDVAQQLPYVQPESQFHAAPPQLAEWVGRADLLNELTADYADPEHRVTGLIGFGGEGKSSLARRWADNLPPSGGDQEGGVFWWGFYDNSNVDEFFEAALNFISNGKIDPRRIPSSSAKAQVVAAMLANSRTLFVLDGLEVLQRQEGDEYGTLTSPDLQTFLELFAAPGHHSFCLITSRAPLLDLMAYTSYTHRDVGPVTPADGRALLRELGVQGRDDALDPLVAQWDGHALTLSLLGTYLAWQHAGDVAYAAAFDPVEMDDVADDAPSEAQRRYAHVHRVLRRYDAHLTAAERAFMTLFSAFRTPVAPDAFARVFRASSPPTGGRTKEGGDTLQAMLAELDDNEFEALVARLVGYRLLRHNAANDTYTTHPLVRNHYLARLTGSGQATQTHDQLKDYYLDLAGDTPHNPTLAQLAPLIEVVYHACRAGAYDEANKIRWERISQQSRYYDIHVLGAYETSLSIMMQFFPDGDASQEPQVRKASDKSWILYAVGLRHMNLGRLETAVSFFERKTKMQIEQEDWRNASIGYNNLAELNANLGRLTASAAAATQALELARRAENKQDEMLTLPWQAWAAHLQGKLESTETNFAQAEELERELFLKSHGHKYLSSIRGIQHAEHLRRVGEADYARRVTGANLEICERNRWQDNWSGSHRVLGELDAAEGQNESARTHFDTALTIARGISKRDVLIEALLARGRWAAKNLGGFQQGGLVSEASGQNLRGLPLSQAFSDLREALGYATDGGYRIHEADIRIALAWAHLAEANHASARQEAARAQTLSQEMGYHWGQVDAAEVLAAIP